MILIVFLAFFTSVNCVKVQTECCLPEQGTLVDEMNVCENIVTKIQSPTLIASCKLTQQVQDGTFNYTITDDGAMIMIMDNFDSEISHGQFCVSEGTVNDTEKVLVFCDDTEEPIMGGNVLEYCMIVSVVFLLLTAFVYCLLPEVRDLQGKSIINFCISLAIGLGILAVMKLMEYSDMDLCAARGFLTYFFLVASFFWMNAIAIQILLSIRRPVVCDYGWKTFFWYALYAWGCPAVLSISMAIVNYHPGKHPKPGIGLNTCWFFNTHQQWYYMYSVMALILVVNIFIFIYISLYLCRHTFSSTHVKAMRYKFVMTTRLCILLGLPWISEMVSTFFPAHIVWVILDMVNTLQGPLIFLILVVFRRRVIKALYKRGYLDCVSGLVEKHLAVAEDDEDIVQHTTDVPLDDRKFNS